MKKNSCKKNVLCLLLSFITIVGLLPAGALADGRLSGEGTEENPYRIETADDLKTFRDLVNAADSSTAYAVLANDIDLKGEEWTPIHSLSAYATTAYAGVFDGDFHSITGLSVNGTEANQGLFAAINGAEIKNLTVEGSVYSTKAYVGGIVGKVQQGKITNCSFSGTVETGATGSSAYAGGLAGYAGNSAAQTAKIDACVSNANVTGGVSGGIVGYAKYTTITDCYNTGAVSGSNRSGGIAGQLQNDCVALNCYNIGEVSAMADICDFLYSSANLTNCWGTTQLSGAGTGTTEGGGIITSAEELLDHLGSAFAEDENGVNCGYPVLSWQKNSALPPKSPKISIAGAALLYMTNSGESVQTTLSVTYTDMDAVPIIWSTDNSDVITIEAPEETDINNTKLIVKAKSPGTAVVTALTEDGAFSADQEIKVMPLVTTVGINGQTVVGQTVSAKVNVLGGDEYDYENYPELVYRWKYLAAEDYNAGNTAASAYKTIEGAINREFTIPDDLKGAYLSFSLWYNGEEKGPSRPVKIFSATYPALQADRDALMIDTSDIKENTVIVLPTASEHGFKIVWTSSHNAIIDPTSGAATLPDDDTEEVTLTAVLSNREGEACAKTFVIKVYSEEALDDEARDKNLEKLQTIVGKLGDTYKMYPVFGTDTNVIDLLKADFARKDVNGDAFDTAIKSVEEIYGGAGIDSDGTITYFYADPNSAPALRMGSFLVTFTISDGSVALDFAVPVIIYWDTDKVKAVMKEEILNQVTDASILGENTSLDNVTYDLSLPKVIDDKKWTLISWSSSDSDTLTIGRENQGTADTLFNPYTGVVKRGTEDKTVTLTATFTFMLTNDVTGNEQPVTMNKVFDVTVKAIGSEQIEAIARELNAKLDVGFEKAGLTDAVTGERLTFDEGRYTAYNDIQLPTTRDFGVDGKYYPIMLSSSDSRVLKTPDVNNAARAEVYRPSIGKDSANARLTVTIRDTNSNVSVSRSFEIVVPALTKDEIEREKALMEKVKSAYFDGIKGENTASGNISKSLAPFMEVYEENGALVWVHSRENMVNHGIVPTPLEGWEELEAWRLFKSSNPAAITHETLLVTMQKQAKAVTVTSALSSETLGKYGKLYRSDPETYADYASLSDLYYQEVSQALVVRGTKTSTNALHLVPVEEKITVYFRLQSSDSTLIETTAYRSIDETLTVFDIFKKALSENGYTYENRGKYVYSVTTPDGITLSETDEGENSGWMYKVNGIIPEVNMGGYGLKHGDEILVYFTKDYMDGKYPKVKGTPSAGKETTSQIPSSDQTSEANTANEPGITGGTEGAAVSYKDVSGHWAESAIQSMNGLGLMRGVGNETFSPDSALTRAMFVTMLYRLENEPETEVSAFNDVESGSWYEKAVSWAKKAGVVVGVSDTVFAPDVNISREQITVILYRYAKFKGYASNEVATIRYSDETDISDYAKEAAAWASANWIMAGNDDGSFAPQRHATRAESAVVFMRMMETFSRKDALAIR